MPIEGAGWEIHIERLQEERRGARRRTRGKYQVYHGGAPVAGLSGWCTEARGPGDNSTADNKRRIEAGRYPMRTHKGDSYATREYAQSEGEAALPKPSLGLMSTGARYDILIHPGRRFLSSVGCINLTRRLSNAEADIDYVDSRKRIIAVIADLRAYLGKDFPKGDNRRIPCAFVVVDGEPDL
jgi:hypothetical protein